MPNIASPLGSTQRYIPTVAPSQLGRYAGLHMVFPTVTDLNTAIADEVLNIGDTSPLWSTGQLLSVATEQAVNVYRKWDASLQHARTLVISPDRTVVLAGNTNTAFATTGVPSAGTGANGDVAIDRAAGLFYTKSGGTWGSGVATSLGGGGGATNLATVASATDVVITSDTGTDATLVLAGANAGLMSPAQVTKLAGIEAGATADMTGAEIVTAINGQLGSTTWQAGAGSLVVQENDTTVSSAATTLDFLGTDFDVTEAPAGEANIAIAAAIARLASPAFTGTPTAPTAAAATDTTQLATTAYTRAEILSRVLTGLAAAGATSAPAATDTAIQAWGKVLRLFNVLTGGTSGQVLKKNSATDFDWSWGADATGAGGSAFPVVEAITVSTPYTLVVGDSNKIKVGNDTAAQTINITTAFNGLGCWIQWNASAGPITLDAGAGVNLNGLGDGVNIVLSDAAGMIQIIPTGTNTWNVVGAIGNLTVADVTDMSANARTFNQAADYAAMRAAGSMAARAQVGQLSFFVPTVADGDVVVIPMQAFAGTVTAVTTDCTSGTCTLTGKVNATNFGGTPNSVSTTKTTQAHASANAFVIGDDLVFTASANASCVGLRVTVTYNRTLA